MSAACLVARHDGGMGGGARTVQAHEGINFDANSHTNSYRAKANKISGPRTEGIVGVTFSDLQDEGDSVAGIIRTAAHDSSDGATALRSGQCTAHLNTSGHSSAAVLDNEAQMRITSRLWPVRESTILPLLAVLALLCVSREARAQGDSLNSPEFRKHLCDGAESTLNQRPAAADAIGRFKRALTVIQSCPEDGPPTLELLWQNPIRDSATLGFLQGVTGHLRDRLLLDVMSRTASDGSQPTDVRLAAMGVLVAYYDSSLTALFPDRGAAATRPRDYVLLGWQTHPVAIQGREPLVQAETRRRILALLSNLAQSDADARVRNSAQYLATFFQRGF